MVSHKQLGKRLKSIVIMSLLLTIILLLAVGDNMGESTVPRLLNYQGKITDANGQPVTGAVSVVFSIYDAPTGGAPLWQDHDLYN